MGNPTYLQRKDTDLFEVVFLVGSFILFISRVVNKQKLAALSSDVKIGMVGTFYGSDLGRRTNKTVDIATAYKARKIVKAHW